MLAEYSTDNKNHRLIIMNNSFLSKFLEDYESSFKQESELNLLRELVGGDSYKINRILNRAELVHPVNGVMFLSMDVEGMDECTIELELLKSFISNLVYLGATVDAENRKGQDERPQ